MAKAKRENQEPKENDQEPKTASGKFIVLQSFRDIVDFNIVHNVGDELSDIEEKRAIELVELQLVAKKNDE